MDLSKYCFLLCFLLFIKTSIAQYDIGKNQLEELDDDDQYHPYYTSDYYYDDPFVINCTVVSKKLIECGDHYYKQQDRDNNNWQEALVEVLCSIFIVLFAGTMSGLTMGLMSMDMTNLKIVARSGDSLQKKYAKKIMPLVRKHHLLLVTLLTCNALAMEALPLFLDRLVGPVFAIILSVTLVLFFGEIIPQALCTRFGLAIGAKLSWLVWILILLSFPISYPLGKLLDCLLGHDAGTIYRRSELKELVDLHASDDVTERLTQDEASIIQGAIDLHSKTADSVLTPYENVSKLDFNQVLNAETCQKMVQEGHSRWPVYRGDVNNVIGMLLVKSLVLINPQDNVPVRNIPLRRLPVVNEGTPLYQVLNMFKQGKSHMAVVLESDGMTVKGIITLEDVVEEIIGKEILDETDVFNDVGKQVRVVRAFKNQLRRGINLHSSNDTVDTVDF